LPHCHHRTVVVLSLSPLFLLHHCCFSLLLLRC